MQSARGKKEEIEMSLGKLQAALSAVGGVCVWEGGWAGGADPMRPPPNQVRIAEPPSCCPYNSVSQ